MPPDPVQDASDAEAHISSEIRVLHDAAFGGRLARVQTHVIDDLVLCLMDLPLLRGEETLIAGGASHEGVREQRRQFEHSVSSNMIAVIEHTTGREVIGFFTDAGIEPPLTVDIFRLAPAPA